MFFATTSASALGAGVGTISSDVMTGLLPYIYVIGGLYVGFWLVKKIVSLIPKSK
jgi:Na+/proline symporter